MLLFRKCLYDNGVEGEILCIKGEIVVFLF